MYKRIPGKKYGSFVKGHKFRVGLKHTTESKLKMSETRKKYFSNGANHPMKGKKHSEKTRKKMSVSHQWRVGEFSSNWKGGITPINKAIRTSKEYKLWRTAVFERDNYTCVWCGIRGGNGKEVILNADHIKSFSQFPELRFAIDNGRTLCVSCHRTTDTFGFKSNKKVD